MTPNLRRLFDEARTAVLNGDDVSDSGDKLVRLLENHGEALVEALEEAFNCFLITQRVEDYPSHEWAPRVQKLLAQLESEAQP